MLMNTPYAVGAAVRGARMRLGLSRADLGRMAGLSLNSVQMLEAGQANPTLDTLLRVTTVLRLDLSAEPAKQELHLPLLTPSATSRKRAEARRQAAKRATTAKPPRAPKPATPERPAPSTVSARTRLDLDSHLQSFAPFDA